MSRSVTMAMYNDAKPTSAIWKFLWNKCPNSLSVNLQLHRSVTQLHKKNIFPASVPHKICVFLSYLIRLNSYRDFVAYSSERSIVHTHESIKWQFINWTRWRHKIKRRNSNLDNNALCQLRLFTLIREKLSDARACFVARQFVETAVSYRCRTDLGPPFRVFHWF